MHFFGCSVSFVAISVFTAGSFALLPPNLSHCQVTERVCPNENVTFHLYTSEQPDQPQQLSLSNVITVHSAKFQPHSPLKILIHGYTGSKDYSPNVELRPAFFAHGQYNVISVDYHSLAPDPCYVSAVSNLPVVANCTAQLIDYLIDWRLVALADVHVIGFSLGAQAAGMLQQFMRNTPFRWMTGLDPAKPLFITAPRASRVDATDATFVDVIHTDVFQRGILKPSGHADFYVNGGVDQPGCQVQTAVSAGSCNHNRAVEYYAESIASQIGFWGFRCAHWYLYALGMCSEQESDAKAVMGMHTDNRTRGLYFLTTNVRPPYAKGASPASNNVDLPATAATRVPGDIYVFL